MKGRNGACFFHLSIDYKQYDVEKDRANKRTKDTITRKIEFQCSPLGDRLLRD